MNIFNELCNRMMVLKRRSIHAPAPSGVPVKPCTIGRLVRALRQSKEEGQALVEVAVAVSLLMMVLTGIFAFGIAFYNKLMLTQAVGAGAQYLQQIRTSSDPCSEVLAVIKTSAPNLTPSKIGLTLVMDGSTSSTISATTVTAATCTSYAGKMVQFAPATVTATYPCSLPIFGFTSTSGCMLSATLTEYVY